MTGLQWAGFVLLLMVSQVHAETLAQLRETDQLRLRSWLEPADGIVVGQEVRLVIEISTRRWFAGGTRLRPPEVPGLVVLQRDAFANNLSRREDGQTWVVQQWRLELYPQSAGQHTLPPVELALSINDASAGIVTGELRTQSHGFSATVPAAMAGRDDWTAAPGLRVSHSVDRELAGLVPGDAFTYTVTLEADHLPAMMLPQPAVTELPGLAAYPDSPVLEDKSNRGVAIARYRQSVVYVVEKAGQYQLPGREFHWWDTGEQTARVASLEPLAIDAGVMPVTAPDPVQTRHWPGWLAALPVLLLVVLLGCWLWRRPTDALAAASGALRRGDSLGAMAWVYRWLNRQYPERGWLELREAAAADPELRAGVDAFLAGACRDETPGDATARGFTPRSLRRVRKTRRRFHRPGRKPRLELNPGSSAGE